MRINLLPLYTAFLLTQGPFALAQDEAPPGVTIVTAPPGQLDLTPPPPEPNDVFGTVNGCASAMTRHDDNGDGVVRRNEYLDFVNNVADQLCIPPRPVLDLELQTVFISIACLCEDLERFDSDCCFGDSAGMYVDGAADPDTRTEEEDSYLRAACLLTQQVLGPDQCRREPATLGPDGGGIFGLNTPAPGVAAGDDDEPYWLVVLLCVGLIFCCICCCCRKTDKEVEEEWETVVTKEVIPMEDPEEPVSDQGEREAPPPPPPPAMIPPPPPEEPFSAGDEIEEEGQAPKPGPPAEPEPAPPIDEDDDGEGKRMGHAPDEDGDDEFGRKFKGQGELPPPPDFVGLKLRHIEKEPPIEHEYEYPERNIEEHKLKREDSGQVLDHYVPDGGVFIPERAKKAPVEMPNPKYERQAKPEPVYIDPRKQRKQMGLGDGEVWEALNNWEDEQQKEGNVEKIEWVIHSALTVFAGAEETGELMKEDDSDEEYDDGETDA